jgi:hypothetical protein
MDAPALNLDSARLTAANHSPGIGLLSLKSRYPRITR